jgi:hypothetical protein
MRPDGSIEYVTRYGPRPQPRIVDAVDDDA